MINDQTRSIGMQHEKNRRNNKVSPLSNMIQAQLCITLCLNICREGFMQIVLVSLIL